MPKTVSETAEKTASLNSTPITSSQPVDNKLDDLMFSLFAPNPDAYIAPIVNSVATTVTDAPPEPAGQSVIQSIALSHLTS